MYMKNIRKYIEKFETDVNITFADKKVKFTTKNAGIQINEDDILNLEEKDNCIVIETLSSKIVVYKTKLLEMHD